MGPLRDNLRNILGIDLFFEHTRTFDARQLRFHILDTVLQVGNGAITQSCL